MAREEELEAALRPFARFFQSAKHMGGPYSPMDIEVVSSVAGQANLTAGDFERAYEIIGYQLRRDAR